MKKKEPKHPRGQEERDMGKTIKKAKTATRPKPPKKRMKA